MLKVAQFVMDYDAELTTSAEVFTMIKKAFEARGVKVKNLGEVLASKTHRENLMTLFESKYAAQPTL